MHLTTPKVSPTANLKGGYKAVGVFMKSFPSVLRFAAFYFPSFSKVPLSAVHAGSVLPSAVNRFTRITQVLQSRQGMFLPAPLQVLRQSPGSLKAMRGILVGNWLKPGEPLGWRS